MKTLLPVRAMTWSALTALIVLIATVATPIAIDADACVEPDRDALRFGGADRYVTSATIARAVYYGEGSRYIVLASGANFPDALAASPLAGSLDAPIVLTPPDQLSVATRDVLRCLDDRADFYGRRNREEDPTIDEEAGIVYILGGTAAVSDTVEDEVEQMGFVTRRIGGSNRYETAAWIAEEVADWMVESDALSAEEQNVVLLVTGQNFADAVAVGPLAFHPRAPYPILLTGASSLHPATAAAIDAIDPDLITILGGTGAVSDAVREAAEARGHHVERVGGKNRFETAILLADIFLARGGEAASEDLRQGVMVARSDGFADSLSAAPLGFYGEAPTVLTPPDSTRPETLDFIRASADTVDLVMAVGSEAAVAEEVLTTYKRAAGQ